MNIDTIRKIFENEICGVSSINELPTDSSHSNFLKIEGKDGKIYICKEVYDKTLAGSDRCIFYEFTAQNLAHELGLAPKALVYNEELNIIISEYIKCISFYNIMLEGVIERAKLAKRFTLVNYNQSDFEIKHCNYIQDFDSHLLLLENALKHIEGDTDSLFYKEIVKFKEIVLSVKSKCLSLQSELDEYDYVISHNDLVAGNVLLDSSGKKYMIDFETVGLTKTDFIIGQLAVDAEIDWYLDSKEPSSLMELFNKLNSVFDGSISFNIFVARILERHIQNVCYGYRQISIGMIRKYPQKYINQKRLLFIFVSKELMR